MNNGSFTFLHLHSISIEEKMSMMKMSISLHFSSIENIKTQVIYRISSSQKNWKRAFDKIKQLHNSHLFLTKHHKRIILLTETLIKGREMRKRRRWDEIWVEHQQNETTVYFVRTCLLHNSENTIFAWKNTQHHGNGRKYRNLKKLI